MPSRVRYGVALAGVLAGVIAVVGFRWGLGAPATVEAAYTEGFYSWVLPVFAWVTGLVPFSVAEMLVLGALALVLARLGYRVFGRRRPGPGHRRRLGTLAFMTLAATGALYAVFVLVWGLNYARPQLEPRLGLRTGSIGGAELARIAAESAAETTRLHRRAGLPAGAVSTSPLDYRALSDAIDAAFVRIGLPGDPRGSRTVPVKPAILSGVMSRLGISGIFVPFTGEPTVNTGPPDVAVTFTAAHEKAHQRAVTHEGEASFAAYLALSSPGAHPYLEYAASFYATRHLIAAAAPEERGAALARLGPGPQRDLEALNHFWAQHRGLVRGAARRVNDSYLRTMQVPGGARSYGTVVRLLVGKFRERGPIFLDVTDGPD